MSEKVGFDPERLWNWISRSTQNHKFMMMNLWWIYDDKFMMMINLWWWRHQSRSMSDPTLSGNDFKKKWLLSELPLIFNSPSVLTRATRTINSVRSQIINNSNFLKSLAFIAILAKWNGQISVGGRQWANKCGCSRQKKIGQYGDRTRDIRVISTTL